MSIFVDYFIILWGFFLIGSMAIGGYFMFRKFLKQLPKDDGKSVMDWENYYFDKTKHMWQEKEKALLEELVAPVPELFRDVARHKIASKIGEIALQRNNIHITEDIVIEGYIIATPKRDHKFLRKKLKEKNINIADYEHLFQLSKSNYRDNWQKQYNRK
ncbi:MULTISPECIES: DUF2621 family protein [unclassified Virgibacillus]|uniref:DUF2621 family protein n=1 Tax=unclassified Virgibacillus TaxID=2620237 RepID=UPI0024DE5280|nr:DUF2621 family protein [Virgibacillus sp. LDC-1]